MKKNFYQKLGELYWKLGQEELKYNSLPKWDNRKSKCTEKIFQAKHDIDKLVKKEMGYSISRVHIPTLTKIKQNEQN